MDDLTFLSEYRECHIVWPRGRMTFNVREFFPCTVRDARKAFPLIREYASEGEQGDLKRYLTLQRAECMERMKELGDKVMDDEGRGDALAEYRRERIKFGRYQRNLAFLERGEGR